MATRKKKTDPIVDKGREAPDAIGEPVVAPDDAGQPHEVTAEEEAIATSGAELSALELEAETAVEEGDGAETAVPEAESTVAPKAVAPKKRRTKKTAVDADDATATSAKAVKNRAEDQEERRKREAARTEKTERNQAFYSGISSLQAAQKTHMVLSGQVVAVERLDRPSGTIDAPQHMIAVSVLLEGRYKVLIPFNELFRDNPIDMASVDTKSREGREALEKRQRQLAEKLYGVCIDFCVTNIFVENPTNYAISGSRREALLAQEKRNFGGKNPRYKVGETYTASILSVGNYALRVNLGGVDAAVALRDTTFEYLPNLHAKYNAGDGIVVKIRDAKVNKETGGIDLDLSAKEPELDRVRELQKTGILGQGTRTIGQITSVRASTKTPGKIIIHAFLTHFKMPAVVQAMSPMDLGVAPKAGDFLRLEVKDFTESGFVRTICRGYQNAAGIVWSGRN